MENPTQTERSASNPIDAMKLLGHSHRTHAITILRTHDTLSIEDLAEVIAEKDSQTEQDSTAIGSSLRHRHLPMLTGADVIQMNGDTLTAGTHLETLSNAYEAFCVELQ